MTPGSIFFDEEFAFHDGETGEKLFVVLGSVKLKSLVAKTTSRPSGRGNTYGCQPDDRFHNFFLPLNSCHLKANTWVCLNEFYELDGAQMLKKRYEGKIKSICTIDIHLKLIQECALMSLDITNAQADLVRACIAP